MKWLCTVMEIARSSFYAWLASAPGRAARTAADQQLAERIRAVHTEDNTHGAPPTRVGGGRADETTICSQSNGKYVQWGR